MSNMARVSQVLIPAVTEKESNVCLLFLLWHEKSSENRNMTYKITVPEYCLHTCSCNICLSLNNVVVSVHITETKRKRFLWNPEDPQRVSTPML